MAFKDTWSWDENEETHLEQLRNGSLTDRTLASIVELARSVNQEKPSTKSSISAYLLNMAIRLKPMHRVLKKTGSIYLHCDPTASHYLKMLMDAIFGHRNYINELVWSYRTGGVSKRHWPKKHDVLFLYDKSPKQNSGSRSKHATHNPEQERIFYEKPFFNSNVDEMGRIFADVYIRDVWDIPAVINVSKERTGYPTQKPIALLERIIKSSSNEGDVVLDPFCGCGTTLHAAEELDRQWVGVDISAFSTTLVRNRLVDNFRHLNRSDILTIGTPVTIADAIELAIKDKFEFEKWVCGEVGAQGMFHSPGDKGPDGGIDGVIPFYHSESLGQSPEQALAVIQVKGGAVKPNDVRALSATVRSANRGLCGVMVCFEKYMNTVENNREKKRIPDLMGDFDYIQGLSVEKLLEGSRPNIPGMLPMAA